jgi:urease accessory protein
VLASASAPAQRLCAVRVLARDATALYRALNACRVEARAYLELPSAAREIS